MVAPWLTFEAIRDIQPKLANVNTDLPNPTELILYADSAADPGGDGLSWETAFNHVTVAWNELRFYNLQNTDVTINCRGTFNEFVGTLRTETGESTNSFPILVIYNTNDFQITGSPKKILFLGEGQNSTFLNSTALFRSCFDFDYKSFSLSSNVPIGLTNLTIGIGSSDSTVSEGSLFLGGSRITSSGGAIVAVESIIFDDSTLTPFVTLDGNFDSVFRFSANSTFGPPLPPNDIFIFENPGMTINTLLSFDGCPFALRALEPDTDGRADFQDFGNVGNASITTSLQMINSSTSSTFDNLNSLGANQLFDNFSSYPGRVGGFSQGTFADDTAAGAGGVAIGGTYNTPTGELRVRVS